MKIELSSKHYLESAKEGGYDLYENVVRENKKTGEKYKDGQIIGYNMSMENSINRIIHLNIHTKNVKVSFKEFLEEYRKEKTELTKVLN